MRNGLRGLHWLMRRLIAGLVLVLSVLAGSACAEEMRIIIAVKDRNLYAVLEDNPASRALYSQMPFTVSMRNLYQREMSFSLSCKLPINKLSANNYKVGDIIYLPHRNSVAILYKQNGDRFRRQNLGHVDAGAEVFASMKDSDITFAPFSE
mgnify:CR=1 FL=1